MGESFAVRLDDIPAKLRKDIQSMSQWEQVFIALFLILVFLTYVGMTAGPVLFGSPNLVDPARYQSEHH